MKSKCIITLDDVLAKNLNLPKGLKIGEANGVRIVMLNENVRMSRANQAEINEFMYQFHGEFPDYNSATPSGIGWYRRLKQYIGGK